MEKLSRLATLPAGLQLYSAVVNLKLQPVLAPSGSQPTSEPESATVCRPGWTNTDSSEALLSWLTHTASFLTPGFGGGADETFLKQARAHAPLDVHVCLPKSRVDASLGAGFIDVWDTKAELG
eukprot:363004-Chlamydomonas_euryale.AAC.1